MVKTETISEVALKELAGFSSHEGLVVSLYLDVDGAKFPRMQDCEKVLHGLINRANQDWVEGEQLDDKNQRRSVARDLELIRDFITGRWRRNGTKGLAVFSSANEGFWQVYELPVGIPSALIVGREPYAKTLTAVLNKYERFCVVSVDRKKSRLFTVYLGAIEEEHGVFVDEWVPDQVKEGEWAGLRQSRIVRHIDDHVMRHVKEIAASTYDIFLEKDCHHLVLSGHMEVLPKFKRVLHPYLRERLVGEFHLDPAAPARDFLEHTLRIEERVREDLEAALIRRLEDESSPGGLAVRGLEETLAALVRGQADTLLIAEDYVDQGFVCYTDHYLATGAGECPVCGRALSESTDIVEDMVQLAINQDVNVEYIAAGNPFSERERIGALLRYAQPRAAAG